MPSSIIDIKSTDTVTRLASGGNAKTDVIIRIRTVKEVFIETISIKNTTRSRVTCHDYTSKDFIRVLGCGENKLGKYISDFEKYGSYKGLLANLTEHQSEEEFSNLMSDYSRKLAEWALTGDHDDSNIIDAATQVSKYILINKNGNVGFFNMEYYIDLLFKNTKLSYGIPFACVKGRVKLYH